MQSCLAVKNIHCYIGWNYGDIRLAYVISVLHGDSTLPSAGSVGSPDIADDLACVGAVLAAMLKAGTPAAALGVLRCVAPSTRVQCVLAQREGVSVDTREAETHPIEVGGGTVNRQFHAKPTRWILYSEVSTTGRSASNLKLHR